MTTAESALIQAGGFAGRSREFGGTSSIHEPRSGVYE